jgi:Domain of unknown function (DUF4836)
MISKHFTGFAIAAIVLLAACGKKAPSYTKYIPKNASNVISIDVKSMLTKLNSDSLTVENMMVIMQDTAHPDDYTKAITLYKELKDAGIDWENKLFISASSLEMMNAGNSPDVQIVAGMKDVAKLEAFLKKQPEMTEIIKGEGFSYSIKGPVAFGWNNDAIMVLMGGNKIDYNDFMPEDSNKVNLPKSESNATGAVEKLKKYFKLTKKESILSVDGFNDLQGKQVDIAIFNQADLEGISAMAFAFLPKLKELIEGVYSATTINFEEGKAVVESKGFVSDKMGALLKKYAGPEVDLGMIENYPSQNVNGVMAFSFKPELIPAMIKETGLDALLGLGLAQTGMGLDDFAKVFKGDFAVVFSDFAMEKKDMGKDAEMYRTEMPTAKLIFAAKIGDKAAFDKLVNFGVKSGTIIRNGTMLIPADNGVPATEMPFAISTANDMLTFASDSATLVAFQNKSQKIGLADDIKSKLKGNAVAAFFDVEKLLNGINDNMFDSTDVAAKNILVKAKATFKNSWFTSSNFNGKSITSKGEVVFGDPKKNSLAQFIRFGMYAAEQEKARKESYNDEWENDIKTVIPLIDSIPPPPPPAKRK